MSFKITVELEEVERLIAATINWAISRDEKPEIEDVLEGLLTAAQKKCKEEKMRQLAEEEAKERAATLEDLVFEGSAPTPDAPRGDEKTSGPKQSHAGTTPAQAPSSADASTQTGDDDSLDAAAIAAATPAGTGSPDEVWPSVLARLQAARKLTRASRLAENRACATLDDFVSSSPRAKDLAGNWPKVVADRREDWAAWKRSGELREQRRSAEAEMERAQTAKEAAQKALQEASRMEAEARAKLLASAPTSGCPPPPGPDATKEEEEGYESEPWRPPRPSTFASTGQQGQQHPRPFGSAGGKMARLCQKCGHPGVRHPFKCPNARNHRDDGFFRKPKKQQ